MLIYERNELCSVLFESTTPMQQKYFGQLDKYTYITPFIFPNDNQQIWLDRLAHFVCYCVKNAVKWFTKLFASPQWKCSNGKILQIHWLLNNCHNYGDTLFKPVPNLMLVNAHAVLDTPDAMATSPAPTQKPIKIPFLFTKGRNNPEVNTAKLGPPNTPAIVINIWNM